MGTQGTNLLKISYFHILIECELYNFAIGVVLLIDIMPVFLPVDPKTRYHKHNIAKYHAQIYRK